MRLPTGSTDLQDAKRRLQQRFTHYERVLLDEIDELARSGFADKRWCAVARTHVEEGIMAFRRALRDNDADPDNYQKIASSEPMPDGFRPRVDPAGDRLVGPHRHIEWHDIDDKPRDND
jgi:hypothetical protein